MKQTIDGKTYIKHIANPFVDGGTCKGCVAGQNLDLCEVLRGCSCFDNYIWKEEKENEREG